MADVELQTLGAEIWRIASPLAEAQNSVKSRALNTPPTPASARVAGDRYIVGPSPTDAWAGQALRITSWTGSVWLFLAPDEGFSAWVDDEDRQVTFDGSVWKTTSGAGSIPTRLNKRMPARTTVGDGDVACDTAVLAKPIPGSFVRVRVNGLDVSDIGDGVKTASCYFSGNGGSTARAWAAIQMGDQLYWNGTIAGYLLNSATDVIDFDYVVEA